MNMNTNTRLVSVEYNTITTTFVYSTHDYCLWLFNQVIHVQGGRETKKVETKKVKGATPPDFLTDPELSLFIWSRN